MINKQRVNRIKTLIYTFIILVLFLPLVLMSILSFRMIGLAQKMSDKLDQIGISASPQTNPSPSGGDYVIEPEGQSTKKGSIAPQDVEGKNSGNANGQVPAASGNQPEASIATPSNGAPESNGALLGDQNPSQVNQGAVSGINNNNSGKLNSDSSPQSGTAAAGSGALFEDPDGNPLTGR